MQAKDGKLISARTITELFSRTLSIATAQYTGMGGIFLIVDEFRKASGVRRCASDTI